MARFGPSFTVASLLLAVLVGGCSLVVDFDRSLLLDAGLDGGVEAGAGAADAALVDSKRGDLVDAGVEVDPSVDKD